METAVESPYIPRRIVGDVGRRWLTKAERMRLMAGAGNVEGAMLKAKLVQLLTDAGWPARAPAGKKRQCFYLLNTVFTAQAGRSRPQTRQVHPRNTNMVSGKLEGASDIHHPTCVTSCLYKMCEGSVQCCFFLPLSANHKRINVEANIEGAPTHTVDASERSSLHMYFVVCSFQHATMRAPRQ